MRVSAVNPAFGLPARCCHAAGSPVNAKKRLRSVRGQETADALSAGLVPELMGNLDRIDSDVVPPGSLVAAIVNFAMCRRQSGTANSSLTLRPSARGWAKRM